MFMDKNKIIKTILMTAAVIGTLPAVSGTVMKNVTDNETSLPPFDAFTLSDTDIGSSTYAFECPGRSGYIYKVHFRGTYLLREENGREIS